MTLYPVECVNIFSKMCIQTIQESVEVRLRLCQMFGTIDLAQYKGVKFENESDINYERLQNIDTKCHVPGMRVINGVLLPQNTLKLQLSTTQPTLT